MTTIRIACETKDHLSHRDLTPLQGDLKSLSAEAYSKLKNEILTTGFAFPIPVWRSPDGFNYVIGGHQRLRVVQELERSEGVSVPPLPVVFVHAENEKEAKRRVLHDVAQYGILDEAGLMEFAHYADLSLPDLTAFDLPGIDLTGLIDHEIPDESVANQKAPKLCPHCGKPVETAKI